MEKSIMIVLLVLMLGSGVFLLSRFQLMNIVSSDNPQQLTESWKDWCKSDNQEVEFMDCLIQLLSNQDEDPTNIDESTGQATSSSGLPIASASASPTAATEESKAKAPQPQVTIRSSGNAKTRIRIESNGEVFEYNSDQENNTAQQQKPNCQRFTVTHLDDSTSSLCYNSSDYAELLKLESTRRSAQTFYQLHQESVDRYQEQYQQTGSDIYLDAIESSQRRADEEFQKRNQAIAQMQTIEQRGW